MFLVLWYLTPSPEEWANWSSLMRFGTLSGLVILGVGIYSLLLLLQGIRPNQFRLKPS